jgi:hypothetical protein
MRFWHLDADVVKLEEGTRANWGWFYVHLLRVATDGYSTSTTANAHLLPAGGGHHSESRDPSLSCKSRHERLTSFWRGIIVLWRPFRSYFEKRISARKMFTYTDFLTCFSPCLQSVFIQSASTLKGENTALESQNMYVLFVVCFSLTCSL